MRIDFLLLHPHYHHENTMLNNRLPMLCLSAVVETSRN
jgi:hypothetical protein